MFVTFTPTVGIQMAIVVFLAWLLRANKVVGLPVVWLSNPATLVPIYWSCYQVGRRILHSPPIGFESWKQLAHPPAGWSLSVHFYWGWFVRMAGPLWLGGIVVGLVAAYPTYYVVYYTIRNYRLRRWGQLTPPDRFAPRKPASGGADQNPVQA